MSDEWATLPAICTWSTSRTSATGESRSALAPRSPPPITADGLVGPAEFVIVGETLASIRHTRALGPSWRQCLHQLRYQPRHPAAGKLVSSKGKDPTVGRL